MSGSIKWHHPGAEKAEVSQFLQHVLEAGSESGCSTVTALDVSTVFAGLVPLGVFECTKKHGLMCSSFL